MISESFPLWRLCWPLTPRRSDHPLLVYPLYPVYAPLLEPITQFFHLSALTCPAPHHSLALSISRTVAVLLVFVLPGPSTVTRSGRRLISSCWIDLKQWGFLSTSPSGQDCFEYIMPVAASLYLLRSMAKPVERHLALRAPGDSVGSGPLQADGPYLETSNCLLCWQYPGLLPAQAGAVCHSMLSYCWNDEGSTEGSRSSPILPKGCLMGSFSLGTVSSGYNQSLSKVSWLVPSGCDGWECSPRSHIWTGRVLGPGNARSCSTGHRQDGVRWASSLHTNLQVVNVQRCEHAPACQMLYYATVPCKVLCCKIKNVLFFVCFYVLLCKNTISLL